MGRGRGRPLPSGLRPSPSLTRGSGSPLRSPAARSPLPPGGGRVRVAPRVRGWRRLLRTPRGRGGPRSGARRPGSALSSPSFAARPCCPAWAPLPPCALGCSPSRPPLGRRSARWSGVGPPGPVSLRPGGRRFPARSCLGRPAWSPRLGDRPPPPGLRSVRRGAVRRAVIRLPARASPRRSRPLPRLSSYRTRFRAPEFRTCSPALGAWCWSLPGLGLCVPGGTARPGNDGHCRRMAALRALPASLS